MGEVFNVRAFVENLPVDEFRDGFIRELGLTKAFSKLCSGNEDLSRFTKEEWATIRSGYIKLGAPEDLTYSQMQNLAMELAARAVTRA